MLIDDVVISQDDDVALYLLGDALRPSRRRNRQPYGFAVVNRQQEQHRRQNRRESNESSSSNRHRGSLRRSSSSSLLLPLESPIKLKGRSTKFFSGSKPNQTQREREKRKSPRARVH